MRPDAHALLEEHWEKCPVYISHGRRPIYAAIVLAGLTLLAPFTLCCWAEDIVCGWLGWDDDEDHEEGD